MGPGVITGAADDDPSGIATYSQVGAQFGTGLLWVMLFSLPLMAASQRITANIGCVTGKGIASNLRTHYSKPVSIFIVVLVTLANIVNIGADIQAMGATASGMLGGSFWTYSIALTAVSLYLQLFVPYHRYVVYLKWLTMTLMLYIATALVVHVRWGKVLADTFLPKISLSRAYMTGLVAVFGTTISPYLLIWQTSEEVEEMENAAHPRRSLKKVLQEVAFDTNFGMAISNIIAWFIILTAAMTLHVAGQLHIDSASQAAKALEPLAGRSAFLLFSIGIIGTGLLALPVLAGSAAYAIAETFGWAASLELKPSQAKGFYAILAVVMMLSLMVPALGMNPIHALYFASIVNGVVAVPLLFFVMTIAAKTDMMGNAICSKPIRIGGWATVIVMAAVTIGMFLNLRS